MRLFNAARVALSVVALCALTACGGGGDDNSGTPYANITLVTSTASNPSGNYQSSTQEKSSQATELGTLESFEFDTVSTSAGFSYIKENSAFYLVGFADDSGDYACASTALSSYSAGALPACPPTVQVDMRSKTVTLSNTVLYDLNGLEPPVTVNGTIHWD